MPKTKKVAKQPVYSPEAIRGILVGSIVLVLIILFIAFSSHRNAYTINSYEECVKAKGSSIAYSYPGFCVTKDGDRFDQPIGTTSSPTPTPATQVRYACPTTEWVNCMPGPDAASPLCGADYLKWAEINCPNFQGAAY